MPSNSMKERHTARCPRCGLRYDTPPGATDFPCPWCSDAHVGVGASYDAAVADAAKRFGQLVRARSWLVATHRVHFADDGILVHVVRLDDEAR